MVSSESHSFEDVERVKHDTSSRVLFGPLRSSDDPGLT